MVNVQIVGQRDNWMWYRMFPVKKNSSAIHAMLNLGFLTCRLFKVQIFRKFTKDDYPEWADSRGKYLHECKSD